MCGSRRLHKVGSQEETRPQPQNSSLFILFAKKLLEARQTLQSILDINYKRPLLFKNVFITREETKAEISKLMH